jgi:hypothetical protein
MNPQVTLQWLISLQVGTEVDKLSVDEFDILTKRKLIVAEDLMEDGAISRISNAHSLRQGRRLPTNIGSRRIAICSCNCNVKKEIKPPHWGGKLLKS